MTVIYGNPRERALENSHAKTKVRLFDPHTQDYLHMGGSGVTRDVTLSWLGHRHQAATLAKRATARGDDWPFKTVPRDHLHPYEPDLME